MRRMVEIPQPTARPPVVKKEKPKLPMEVVKGIVKGLELSVKRLEIFDRKYKHISDKYGEDLGEFIKREGDKLPEWDWGKKVLFCCKLRKRQIQKLRFYNKILAMNEQSNQGEGPEE